MSRWPFLPFLGRKWEEKHAHFQKYAHFGVKSVIFVQLFGQSGETISIPLRYILSE